MAKMHFGYKYQSLDGTRKPMSSIIIMISIEKPPVDGFI
jgi:hypothetical protein